MKIRLQMQGEAAKKSDAVPRGAIHIVRQLGLLGLYKGAGAWYVIMAFSEVLADSKHPIVFCVMCLFL